MLAGMSKIFTPLRFSPLRTRLGVGWADFHQVVGGRVPPGELACDSGSSPVNYACPFVV